MFRVLFGLGVWGFFGFGGLGWGCALFGFCLFICLGFCWLVGLGLFFFFLVFSFYFRRTAKAQKPFQMPETGFDLLVSFLTNDIAVWIKALKKKPIKYNGKTQLYLMLAAMATFL